MADDRASVIVPPAAAGVASRAWWGEREVAEGRGGRWRIGPFSLAVRREPLEWRLAWERGEDLHDPTLEVDCPRAEVEEQGRLLRVVSGSGSCRFTLAPRLADRPIVARPEKPFRLLPGSRVNLYVAMPVWIRVEVDHPPHEVLDEATWRLSDTWFGSPQGDGELCYAIKTHARLHLENVPILPHRAITKVVLENRGSDVLPLERLSLPAPNLSLYADADAHLWTQVVHVECDREGVLAEVDMGKGPPEEARHARLLAGPRFGVHRNVLVRTISAFLL